ALGPKGIAAIRAVLPADTVVGAVGGVSEMDFADYARIGVRTFGLGSSLFTSDMNVETVRARAVAAVTAWDEVFGQP
ncbi:2-dehydro-3-deoxy-6-phosphogalactonate aldolase, partial [Rhizobiaceae sp. 2RAB30]